MDAVTTAISVGSAYIDREAICRRIIEECAAFNGDDGVNDDAVEALTMAVSVWCYKGGG